MLSLLYGLTPTSIHDNRKNCSFDCVGKVMSLLFNLLSRFVIVLHSKSKEISCLQSPPAVILEPKKTKSVTASTFSPSNCDEVMEPDAMILVFSMLSFKPTFSLSSRGSLVPLGFFP